MGNRNIADGSHAVARAAGQRGFTLVEIAIVLVTIGLLLGGVLKGVELITSAKINNIIASQNAIKVSWFSFINRYGSLPGDFSSADNYFKGEGIGGDGDGTVRYDEASRLMYHLTESGLIECGRCAEGDPTQPPTAANSLTNQFGGIITVWADSLYYLSATRNPDDQVARHQVHTGPRIPSDVLAIIDEKIDDGYANDGDFVFNSFDPTSIPDEPDTTMVGECVSWGSRPGKRDVDQIQTWRDPSKAPAVWEDCGGALML